MSDIQMAFHNLDAAEKIRDRLDSAFRASMSDLGDVGQDAAEERVRSRGAVASSQLIDGFRNNTVGGNGEYMTEIYNHATYAKYVDEGVRGTISGFGPHQYTTKKPPLAPLAAWANLKLSGYRVDLQENRLVPVESAGAD